MEQAKKRTRVIVPVYHGNGLIAENAFPRYFREPRCPGAGLPPENDYAGLFLGDGIRKHVV
jgi:hypothetical protein